MESENISEKKIKIDPRSERGDGRMDGEIKVKKSCGMERRIFGMRKYELNYLLEKFISS